VTPRAAADVDVVPDFTIYARLVDTAGLAPRARVTIAGVTVGEVVAVDGRDVELRIRGTTMIRVGATPRRTVSELLGEVSVDIGTEGWGTELLGDGDVLEEVPSRR
jgi:phospholipid/cholesterol/gamma-HCH transport system substrate-binding protein